MMEKNQSAGTKNLSSVMGDAITATILLRNWEKYGLSDRVCYHFDLTEAIDFLAASNSGSHGGGGSGSGRHNVQSASSMGVLSTSAEVGGSATSTNDVDSSSALAENNSINCCGVLGLLECVPFAPWYRLTKNYKRALRNEIRNFNLTAHNVHQNSSHGGAGNRKYSTVGSSSNATASVGTNNNNSSNANSNTTGGNIATAGGGILVHEPKSLPLRLNPATRVFFTYEVTRIAFCLDASPTLTSTFGNTRTYGVDSCDDVCCPLDRVAQMARTFFRALVQPISVPNMPHAAATSGSTMYNMSNSMWRPEICISVVAVYPRGSGMPQTSLLVRDFKLEDMEAADLLANKIEEWALGEVETEISYRLGGGAGGNITGNDNTRSLLCGYDAWTVSMYSSSLKDILDVGDATLSNLSSQARPCIVVATDGRSVSCDNVIDILSDADRADVPVVVLDLSSPSSHNTTGVTSKNSGTNVNSSVHHSYVVPVPDDGVSLMSYDPSGPSTFPLHLSDDTEALLGICKATGGCFFDTQLLNDASRTIAGQVESDSPFNADHFFSFKRRSLKPNGVQWYTLFALSPLSPTLNSSWGKLVQPRYLRYRRVTIAAAAATTLDSAVISQPISGMPSATTAGSSSGAAVSFGGTGVAKRDPLAEFRARHNDPITTSISTSSQQQRGKPLSRTTFSTYIVNPIRIKGILLMRVKEGYRAKQYGQSTQDPDKVFIQFNLPLELGTVLHYELSYKALTNQSHMVGVAHVKIELSGETGFIQSVKRDFLRQSHTLHIPSNYGQHHNVHHHHHHTRQVRRRPATMAQQISAKLCKVLRWIRKEDVLQSYLCPLRWSDQLSGGPETPFLRRLRTLTPLQRRRHFRFDQFEVVCVGRMPYVHDDEFILSEFVDLDDGEQELIDAIEDWSTQVIKEGRRYVKKIDSTPTFGNSLAAYCVVEISKSPIASRVFTVAVECFGVSGAPDRLDILVSLKKALSGLKDVVVLSKEMAKHVVVVGGGGGGRAGIGVTSTSNTVKGGEDQQYSSVDQIPLFSKQYLLENHYHHASWDLVKDPEVLPLLMKRRTEIGNFKLMQSSDQHALFAKLVPGPGNNNLTSDNPGIFVQYHIAILDSSVVIDLYMESESNNFFPFRPVEGNSTNRNLSQFHVFAKNLKRRDQECGRALRCRTSLLQTFDSPSSSILSPTTLTSSTIHNEKVTASIAAPSVKAESHYSCVKRLLPYSSRVSRKLRFFHPGSGNANDILQSLTVDMLLSKSFRVQVASIPLEPNEEIGSVGKGIWFIIKFDRHTMSMVHLSMTDKLEGGGAECDAIAGDRGDVDDIKSSADYYDTKDHKDNAEKNADDSSFVFRELTFFTIGISDLYSARDDVVDDDTTGDHISEYLCVSEFADLVDIAHKENYAAAAYLALNIESPIPSSHPSNVVESFHPTDFGKVLSACEFVQVARVLVPSTTDREQEQGQEQQQSHIGEERSKLQQLIGTVLHSVGGHSTCLYYCGDEGEAPVVYHHQLAGNETDSLSAFEDLEEMSLDDLNEEEENRDRFSSLSDTLVGVTWQAPAHSQEEEQGAQLQVLEHNDGDAYNNDDDNSNSDTDSLLGLPLQPDSTLKTCVASPLFVQFTLDGKVASMSDLAYISKSTILAAHVSVFKRHMTGRRDNSSNSYSTGTIDHSQHELHRSHGPVALALSDLLNAYVAEQTMERLRTHGGASLSESDLRLVKTCLRRARDVVTSKIEVYFYVAKTDSMVPASAPAGRETQIEGGFRLLMKELRNNGFVALKEFPHDIFVVVNTAAKDESDKNDDGDGYVNANTNALPFWCLINIRKRRGIISVEIHHPEGAEQATEVMSMINEIISFCYHRVNQLLLLEGLHRSRIASELLIPREPQSSDDPDSSIVSDFNEIFKPGLFSCPIVFCTTFDLNHRCATNPGQVARKLEETVLHNFAVSNRRGIFVYKDETGAIFYMTLEAVGRGVEADGKVKLLVHGVQEPGPSVTKQLKQLLQKRLLMIAVDMLSSFLTKNPQFHWKKADLEFIRCFEREWKSVEGDQHSAIEEKERFYELPMSPQDAGICLFILRQNLCGSTFFHRLHTAVEEGDTRTPPSLSSDDPLVISDRTEIDFNNQDFIFYYNNAATKLDPKFQPVSTLTNKGAEYSRKAGSGIAILEISIAHTDGMPVKKLRFGSLRCDDLVTNKLPALPKHSLRRVLDHTTIQEAKGQCESALVQVRITDTALNSECLHDWLHLSLSQMFSSWSVEKLVETMQRKPFQLNFIDESLKSSYSSDADRNAVIDQLCPGLPALTGIFESMNCLPHPALSKVESPGVVRASSIATVTLDLLEKIIMKTILTESRMPLSGSGGLFSDLCVIRLSRSDRPRIVKLDWDANKREAVVLCLSKGARDRTKIIRDSPVDCPEYICFYCCPNQFDKYPDNKKSLPMLFKEVMIADGSTEKSSEIGLLELWKQHNPSPFYRSFAFVFSVKRVRRSLLAYNWIPQVFKTVSTRLLEKDRSFVSSAARSIDALQRRTLKMLAPPIIGINRTTAESSVLTSESRERRSNVDAKKKQLESTSSSGPADQVRRSGRANRPVFIRRPKLIGKSVEGAARQAVAASRAKASANRFRGTAMASSSQPARTQRDDGSKSSKSTEANRPSHRMPNQSSKKPRDEALARAESAFDSVIKGKSDSACSATILQGKAIRALTTSWWPTKTQQKIPRSVGNFILSRSPFTWVDVCEPLPLPARFTASVPLSLARTIAMWTPGLELVPILSANLSTAPKPDSILLMGEIKNVRSCKCFAVVEIGRTSVSVNGNCREMIRSKGWVLTLPRRPTNEQKSTSRMMTSSLSEKDVAGLDKLTTHLHAALVLESLQFDFVGSVIERVMKSVDKSMEYTEVMPLLQSMMKRYPFQRQRWMRRLNYRLFEAKVVLSSYQNKWIDMYDAQILFRWLKSNASNRELIRCANNCVCFKQEIIVRGTHSTCFLTCGRKESTELKLLILCRTQGRDLYEYMFRQGSNIAISILDNIAVEAAGLAYEELRSAAEYLRRNALWEKLSMIGVTGLGLAEIDEFLHLSTAKPLLQDGQCSADAQRIKEVIDYCEMDWNKICVTMKHDSSFSPSWAFSYTDSILYLFFLKFDDLFLLVRVSKDGFRMQLDLVEKDDGITRQQKRNVVLQKFTNYILHYLWNTI